MKVKIISLTSIDVQNGKVPTLEEQVNTFIADVIPVSFSYSLVAGFQSVLIAYQEKPKKPVVKHIEPER